MDGRRPASGVNRPASPFGMMLFLPQDCVLSHELTTDSHAVHDLPIDTVIGLSKRPLLWFCHMVIRLEAVDPLGVLVPVVRDTKASVVLARVANLAAYENYFPSSRAARAHIRRKAKRLGVLHVVPGDAFPGNWAAFRVTVQEIILARGIQLDLFEQLRRDTIRPKGKGQLGLF